jgi:hypothetical protein
MPTLVPLKSPEINTQLHLVTLKHARMPPTAQRLIAFMQRQP